MGPRRRPGPVANAAAETHVRLLAEAQLRRAAAAPRYLWLDEDFKMGGTQPEEEGLHRIKAVLNALHRVGALSDGAAWSVLSDFAAALAARGLAPADSLLRTAAPGSPRARTGRACGGAAPRRGVPGHSDRRGGPGRAGRLPG